MYTCKTTFFTEVKKNMYIESFWKNSWRLLSSPQKECKRKRKRNIEKNILFIIVEKWVGKTK